MCLLNINIFVSLLLLFLSNWFISRCVFILYHAWLVGLGNVFRLVDVFVFIYQKTKRNETKQQVCLIGIHDLKHKYELDAENDAENDLLKKNKLRSGRFVGVY